MNSSQPPPPLVGVVMNSQVAENNHLTIKWWNSSCILQFEVKLIVSNADEISGIVTSYHANLEGSLENSKSKFPSMPSFSLSQTRLERISSWTTADSKVVAMKVLLHSDILCIQWIVQFPSRWKGEAHYLWKDPISSLVSSDP